MGDIKGGIEQDYTKGGIEKDEIQGGIEKDDSAFRVGWRVRQWTQACGELDYDENKADDQRFKQAVKRDWASQSFTRRILLFWKTAWTNTTGLEIGRLDETRFT